MGIGSCVQGLGGPTIHCQARRFGRLWNDSVWFAGIWTWTKSEDRCPCLRRERICTPQTFPSTGGPPTGWVVPSLWQGSSSFLCLLTSLQTQK